jgi:uncharacterized protein YyaL (SSP411 family)
MSVPGALDVRIKGAVDRFGPLALQGKGQEDGKATAYVCIGTHCQPPVTDGTDLRHVVLEARSTA